MRMTVVVAVLSLTALTASAAEMDWIQVSKDGKGFVFTATERPFVPWGFNYDRDAKSRLLEDYWIDEWGTVKSDFREMKELGANVVRVHLQFGKFMESPTAPRRESLAQLARLLKLAEDSGLYLDVTGLGCYHKQDVPAWYDALNEQERWQAQAMFWEAIAQTCAKSPAVFCYNLMNEPVVAGGNDRHDDWLGPAFAGKHFVQLITLDRAGRERPDIARAWIQKQVSAIRKQDHRHLITVGLVPWSLDRPGLTSGFIPAQVAGELDFVAVHLYPEQGKIDEAIGTLKGFAEVGKPVVIEEMFPLACDAPELGRFIDESASNAVGWIGFYWGQTPEELRPPQTPGDALTLAWLELFQTKASQIIGKQPTPALN